MKACMVENGMHFDEKEVSDLANALFDDAVKVSVHICINIRHKMQCKTLLIIIGGYRDVDKSHLSFHLSRRVVLASQWTT